jgi:hypothetical protein
MQIVAVPILAEMLKAYYQPEELQEISGPFDVVFDLEGEQPFFAFAKSMVTSIKEIERKWKEAKPYLSEG